MVQEEPHEGGLGGAPGDQEEANSMVPRELRRGRLPVEAGAEIKANVLYTVTWGRNLYKLGQWDKR